MEEIIGLNAIKQQIDSYTFNTLPHSVILLGKEGAGKRLLVSYITNKFNIELLDITKDLSDELIDNIYRFPGVKAYLIDLRRVTEKTQNIILKFFEEPPVSAFIFVVANSANQVLPTVLNRGIKLYLPKYTEEELRTFARSKNIELKDDYKNIIETPGDILRLYTSNTSLEELEQLVDKIESKLNIASFANTLSIADKLNYDDEYDKFDVNFFLQLLCIKYAQRYINDNIAIDNKLFHVVNEYKKRLEMDPRLNKRLLISNMLCKLWKEVNA